MPVVTEIAPDVYRISTYFPEMDLQFSQFLVKDEEPLLFHTGMKAIFPMVREGVATVMDPSKIRWISFSHFEADECGSLNEWLRSAPGAQAACSMVGALVSINDFAQRPAKGMIDDEVLSTGQYRFRFIRHHMCRIAGRQDCCLRKPTRRFFAQTSFIRVAMSNR